MIFLTLYYLQDGEKQLYLKLTTSGVFFKDSVLPRF